MTAETVKLWLLLIANYLIVYKSAAAPELLAIASTAIVGFANARGYWEAHKKGTPT